MDRVKSNDDHLKETDWPTNQPMAQLLALNNNNNSIIYVTNNGQEMVFLSELYSRFESRENREKKFLFFIISWTAAVGWFLVRKKDQKGLTKMGNTFFIIVIIIRHHWHVIYADALGCSSLSCYRWWKLINQASERGGQKFCVFGQTNEKKLAKITILAQIILEKKKKSFSIFRFPPKIHQQKEKTNTLDPKNYFFLLFFWLIQQSK